MQDWFDHIEMAASVTEVTPSYVFVGSPSDPTFEVIEQHCVTNDRRYFLVPTDEPVRADVREWDEARFRHMVGIRNQLLQVVRGLEPEHFLSIDSDILLHPQALTWMLQARSRFDGVGSATFMTETGDEFPNCGWLSGMTGMQRRRIDYVGTIPVDIIMAIKLMSPAAYAVDYELHPQGEDIGWSAACGRAGVKLGWDNHAQSKHVMHMNHLDRVDVRVGW